MVPLITGARPIIGFFRAGTSLPPSCQPTLGGGDDDPLQPLQPLQGAAGGSRGRGVQPEATAEPDRAGTRLGAPLQVLVPALRNVDARVDFGRPIYAEPGAVGDAVIEQTRRLMENRETA